MRIRSLGIESDLIFHRRNGEVVERGSYLLVRTPRQPSYFWGNYLIYGRAPEVKQLSEWEATFGREFAGQALSTHRSFTWDASGMADPLALDEVEAFKDLGYEYDSSVVLTASRVIQPPHPAFQLEYRHLLQEDDWEQMFELQVQNRSVAFAEAPYREFLRARIDAWRRLVNAGAGVWLGAFDADQLVADAGLFWAGRLGRFQNVETRDSHRRRGICGTLVHRLSEYGFTRAGLTQLVMLADEDYHAARIYESLGFERVERVGSLCFYDRNHWNS